MAVMGTMFGGIFLSTRGGGQKKQATPPIQASSKDEEKFIQYVASMLHPRGSNELNSLQWHTNSAQYHWSYLHDKLL
jgi:hypothetical protein